MTARRRNRALRHAYWHTPSPAEHLARAVLAAHRAKAAAMQALGDLLASTMPDPDDNDDCGMVLG